MPTPAVAITSSNLLELTSRIDHSPGDTPDLVDADQLAQIAFALRDLVQALGKNLN